MNVFSYSYQVFSGSTDASVFTMGAILNILKWQQVIGEDKYPNLFAAVEDIFIEKQILMSANPNISCCDMHDGKMVYLLTQHALLNCKHHQFLLCKFRPGEGIFSPNHQCILLTQ